MKEIDIFRDFLDYMDSRHENEIDAEIDKMWKSIPTFSNEEYIKCENVEEIDYDGICPYCHEYVGITEDIYPPSNCIGKKDISRYETAFFRKCPHCEKIFSETMGEDLDYNCY